MKFKKQMCTVLAGLMALCQLMPAWSQTPVTVAGKIAGQVSVTESGAASYRIPIEVPPGVAGMQPQLALVYNSQSGNGLLGVGWNLEGLSAITRCPKTMAQDGARGAVQYDMSDRYCLDGQRLMLVSGTYGAANSEYRTERESFSKVVAYGSAGNGPAYFVVQTKSGQTLEYGNTADSRIEAVKAAGSIATWPVGTVRTWAVNKVTDAVGNYMTTTYVEDGVNGSFYPGRIDYTGNGTAAPSHSVRFNYEARPDVVPAYMTGSLVKTTTRILGIHQHVGDELRSFLEVSYTNQLTGQSRVASIRACTGTAVCMQPVTFSYGSGPTEWVEDSVLAPPWPLWSRGFDNEGVQLVDVNGDGLVDVIRSLWVNGEIKKNAWINTPDGWQESSSYEPPWPLWSRGYDSGGVQLVDINGDGLVDILRNLWISGVEYKSAWLNTGSGWEEAPQFSPPWPLWSRGFDNEGVSFVDVNGDGLPDVIRSLWVNGTVQKAAWLNTGNGWQAAPEYAPPWPLWSRDYDSGGVQLVDINGDGLVDIVRNLWIGGVEYKSAWLNTGGGWEEAPQYAPPWPLWARGFDNEGMQFLDVNGDGLPDIVRSLWVDGVVRKTAWLNTGSGWLEAAQYAPPWPLWTRGFDNEGIQLADVDGDGVVDIARNLWVSGTFHKNVWRLSPVGSALSAVSVGTTTIATVLYKPVSTPGVHAADGGVSGPVTFHQRALGLVVSQVDESNGLGGVVSTQYTYGGLKAEVGTGRGLLGFRWMNAKNVSTGVETYTEYRQDWPYVGLVAKAETRLAGSGSAGVLKRVTNTYGCQHPGTGTACTVAAGNRYFAYASQSVEEGWDLNGAVLPVATSVFTYGQSPQWGDPTQIVVSTGSGGGSASKTTVNEWWPAETGGGKWISGRLKRATVTSVSP